MYPLDSGGKRKPGTTPCNLRVLLFLTSVLYWYNERTKRKFLGFCIRCLKREENMFIVSLFKKKGIILATVAKAHTSPCFVFLECVMSPGIPLSHCSVVESKSSANHHQLNMLLLWQRPSVPPFRTSTHHSLHLLRVPGYLKYRLSPPGTLLQMK